MSGKATPQVLLNYLRSVDGRVYDQFTIDFIEDESDNLERIAEGEQQNTYDEARGALHYRVRTALEIMRADAKGRPFFEKLLALTA